jgi:hypothetical protein
MNVALSAFDDKLKQPTEDNLRTMLGRTARHWDDLKSHVAAQYPPLDETWNFAGANYGWSLRLKQKKRTVLYMTPCKGHFLVGLVLGGKAVMAAHDANLPDAVLTIIDSAPKYAEGTGVRLAVRSKKDLQAVKDLAAIKMAN